MLKIGRSYAGIDAVNENSKKNGYQVFECHSKDESGTDIQKEREESVIDCLKQLVEEKIDALYLTTQSGVNDVTIKQIVEITQQYKIPTFSQAGESEVQQGILFGVSNNNFSHVGKFEAKNIIKIKNGEKISNLKQLLRDPFQLSFNQTTAKIIGYEPSNLVRSLIDDIK